MRYADFGQKPWRYTVFEKKSPLVHKYKPYEVRFWATRFFSGPKNSVSQGLAVHDRKINVETIWNFHDFTTSINNSRNYSRKYGMKMLPKTNTKFIEKKIRIRTFKLGWWIPEILRKFVIEEWLAVSSSSSHALYYKIPYFIPLAFWSRNYWS